MTVLLDTSALIALTNSADKWHPWATDRLSEWKTQAPLIITEVVYAEASVALPMRADMDAIVQTFGLDLVSCSLDALFDAGKAFHVYKNQNKGPKCGVLPDFFIGAFALREGILLATTNPKDFETRFPGIQVDKPI